MPEDRPRSREGFEPGQQLYAVIEFCTDPETLWSKVASGHWDWLGVRQRRKGQLLFVLGSPPVGRLRIHASFIANEAIASVSPNRHRVTIETPDTGGGTNEHWYPTAEAATAAFDDRVGGLRAQRGNSALFRVRLYVGGERVREEFVVRAWPNEL